MASEISVIICAYTEKRLPELIAAVESVQRQTLPPREIILVVDHNRQLLELVQSRLVNVMVIENTEVRGLSGARNSGIALARGEILAFLDDDALADPDWLETLAATFSGPEILGVGGSIQPLWLEKTPTWLPEEFYWVVGCTYRGMPVAVSKIRNPIGANMALRREVFAVAGGFLSGVGRVGTLPLGCEETELSIRAQQYWPQRSFLYQPAARVSHRVPATRTNWRYFFSRCYAEGISKAVIARYVGAGDSLSSERAYTLHVLPLGIRRGLADGLFRRDPGGFARAWAILAGLGVTATGYLRGIFSARRGANRGLTGYQKDPGSARLSA